MCRQSLREGRSILESQIHLDLYRHVQARTHVRSEGLRIQVPAASSWPVRHVRLLAVPPVNMVVMDMLKSLSHDALVHMKPQALERIQEKKTLAMAGIKMLVVASNLNNYKLGLTLNNEQRMPLVATNIQRTFGGDDFERAVYN